MKSVFFSGVMIVIMAGCRNIREQTAEELLKNPKMEDEIYTAVLGNTEYSSRFINKMMAYENCKSIIARNSSFVRMMCMSQTLDSLLKNDTEMMEAMTDRMVNRMESDTTAFRKVCAGVINNKVLKK